MAAINVLVVAAPVGVDFVAASEEAATAMTYDLTELEQEYSRISDSWDDGIGSHHDKLEGLRNVLEELWHMDGTGALDLRRRIRTFIDEAEHVVRHEQIRRVK
jgi:hypothetical protein